MGLEVDYCDPTPIRIYDVATGSVVYSGSSRGGCTYEAGYPVNFRIDLNSNCPSGSSDVSLPVGPTYLLEVDFGGSGIAKGFFTPTTCPAGTACDSTFRVQSDSISRTSGTLYDFAGYPSAQLLSAALWVTGSQRVGKKTTYYLQMTASPNIPSNFTWSGVAGVLSPANVNPNRAYVNVWDGSPVTATVTVTSDWTRARETVTRSIQLGDTSY